MSKELFEQKDFIFRCDGSDHWYCTNFRTALTPADFAEIFGYSIPDHTQFLRIKDYDNNMCFEYRHYAGIIRINLYSI